MLNVYTHTSEKPVYLGIRQKLTDIQMPHYFVIQMLYYFLFICQPKQNKAKIIIQNERLLCVEQANNYQPSLVLNNGLLMAYFFYKFKTISISQYASQP